MQKNTKYFTEDQQKLLNEMTGKIEERTGIELVAAIVGRCDNYPEIPWKAFALAAALGALAHLAASMAIPVMDEIFGARSAAVMILCAGAAFALLSAYWPAFGRLFLDRLRAESETEQYARAFFLEREIFRTRGRTGILVLAGLFERRVVIVPDVGISGRIGVDALNAVIDSMTPHLRNNDRFQAFVSGLSVLEQQLVDAGFGPATKGGNEIPDAIIQQKGDGA